MSMKSRVKIHTTIPIPAYEMSLKNPILLSFMISWMLLDLVVRVFNCRSCFCPIWEMTTLSFFKSDPISIIKRITHAYGLPFESIQQVEHFLFDGLLMAFVLKLLLVLLLDQIDDLLVFIDKFPCALVQVLDDTLKLNSNCMDLLLIFFLEQVIEVIVQLKIYFLLSHQKVL